MRVGRHIVTLSNWDKLLFPVSGITKGDLISYYERIAPIMLPHIKNRPITMKRYPKGINEDGFFHKNTPDYFPSWIPRLPVEKNNREIINYVLCNNVATLVYLANYGCITPHVWLSSADKPNYPNRMIFDLDPSVAGFDNVKKAAFLLKDVLDLCNLPSFLMTTGSRGLHVVVPLKRVALFERVRAIARDIAVYCVKQHPRLLTIEMRKINRGKKIFIDYLRNAWAQTAVAPYAVRARPDAPVATPIRWEELKNKITSSNQYTVKTIFRRLAQTGDIWNNMMQSATTLTGVKDCI